jgi:rfaE bifunctional protein nucleotidyltransferase chain/domain
MPKNNPKILSRSDLKKKIKTASQKGKKIVFTNGCFDLLHVGHVRLLRKAKSLGHILIVAVNSDRSVNKLKGKGRPIVPLSERMEMLSALNDVDYVVPFSEDTPLNIIQELTPSVLVKGGDYKIKDIVGAAHIQTHGGKICIFPFVKGKSTSSLLERLKSV